MRPSIEAGPTPRNTAVVVLSTRGLALAQRLRAARPGATSIFGPSCVVGPCGGPGPTASGEQGLPPGTFATVAPGVFGWTGPLRLVLPALWARFEAIVAVMAIGIVVRLSGPLALDRRRDPALVVVDESGRFAISLLDGRGARADDLARHVAATVGALAVVANSDADAHARGKADAASGAQRDGYDGGEGGPNPGA